MSFLPGNAHVMSEGKDAIMTDPCIVEVFIFNHCHCTVTCISLLQFASESVISKAETFALTTFSSVRIYTDMLCADKSSGLFEWNRFRLQAVSSMQ